MKPKIRTVLGLACAASSLFLSGLTVAQQVAPSSHPLVYELRRETVLQGAVISYTPSSPTPPLGAHVSIQTASGAVDVQIGTAKFLELHQFSISPGDNLKIVGASVSFGNATQFVARVIQKGTQFLAIRSTRGFPLWLGGKPEEKSAGGVQQGGVL